MILKIFYTADHIYGNHILHEVTEVTDMVDVDNILSSSDTKVNTFSWAKVGITKLITGPYVTSGNRMYLVDVERYEGYDIKIIDQGIKSHKIKEYINKL